MSVSSLHCIGEGFSVFVCDSARATEEAGPETDGFRLINYTYPKGRCQKAML